MKKQEGNLEERIVATALRLFNERGIEYVGMRELATELGIRIGNLNYYFPTKDDLVYRLSQELAQDNNQTIVAMEVISMTAFFDMLRQVFDNHVKYRCLMLSFVHIIQRNAAIARRYNKTLTERNQTWDKNVKALITSREIKANKTEIDFLVSTLALVARFWISESVVSFRDETEEKQKRHYLALIARVFLPYATTKGRKFLNLMLAQE